MLKQPMCNNKTLLIGLLLFVIPAVALALPGDRDKPIQIDADAAERSEKTGVTSYIGSVELTQGSLNILADRIDIYTINAEVDHAIATGQRAYFTQQQSIDKEPIKAWALTIKYSLNDEIINLLGDARIEQNGSIVSSPEIDYYANQELVKAKGDTQGGKDRVHVTLPPQNKPANADIEIKDTTPVAIDEKTTTIEEDVAAAIEPLVAVVEPLINAAIEQIKAVPDNTNETP
jgi:lipopolysaccharide export system protein LptA